MKNNSNKKVLILCFMLCLTLLFSMTLVGCAKPKTGFVVRNSSDEVVFDSDRKSIDVELGNMFVLPQKITYDEQAVTGNSVALFDKDGNSCALSYGAYTFNQLGEYKAVYKATFKGTEYTLEVSVVCKDTTPPEIKIVNYSLYALIGDVVTLPVCTFSDYGGIDEDTKTYTVTDPNGETVDVTDGAFTVDMLGNYKVVISVKDESGNETSINCNTECIDKYIDTELEENIIYNFNNDGYLTLLRNIRIGEDITRSIVTEGYPAISSEPSGNGVLAIESNKVYGDVHTQFLLHTDLLASSGYRIVVKFAVSKDTDYVKLFSETSTALSYTGNAKPPAAQIFGVEKDTWYELEVNPLDFGYNKSFKDFVFSYRDTGGLKMYIDEIYFTEPVFVDEDWSETNLADFDEQGYLHNIYQNMYNNPTTTRAYRVGGTTFEILEAGNAKIPATNGSTSKSPGLGADGGVLHGFTTAKYGGMTYMFPQTLDLEELLGITFKIFTPQDNYSMTFGFFDGSGADGGNTKWMTGITQPEPAVGEWWEFTFGNGTLSRFATDGKISGFFIQMMPWESSYDGWSSATDYDWELDFYFDQVTAIYKNDVSEQNGDIIANFENNYLGNVIQNDYMNTATHTIVQGTGTNTSNVLKVVSNESDDGLRYVFDKPVSFTQGNTIAFDISLQTGNTFTDIVVGVMNNINNRDQSTIKTIKVSSLVAGYNTIKLGDLSTIGEVHSLYVRFVSSSESQNNIAFIDNIRSDDATEVVVDVPIASCMLEAIVENDVVTSSVPLKVELGGQYKVGDIIEINFRYKTLDYSAVNKFIRVWPNADIVPLGTGGTNQISSIATAAVASTSIQTKTITQANITAKIDIETGAVYTNDYVIDSLLFGFTDGAYATLEIYSVEVITVDLGQNGLIKFNSTESLALVTGGVTDQVNLDTVDDRKVLNARVEASQEAGVLDADNPLRIDLGGYYKVSNIESIKITYKVTDADASKPWMRLWLNDQDASGQHVTSFTGAALVITAEFKTQTITQAQILNKKVSDIALFDENTVLNRISLGFTDTDKYTTILIESIELVLLEVVDESLLDFNSQDSLSIVSGGLEDTVKIETDGDVTALSAKMNIANSLRIDLGGAYTVNDIAEIKITYKITVIEGSGPWMRVWINRADIGHTGGIAGHVRSLSNSALNVMSDYAIETIDYAMIIGKMPDVGTEALQYITFGFADDKGAVMLIDSIEIVLK